ncbi:hypothetical protein WN943_021350 [Citrus x changshan-huyou]
MHKAEGKRKQRLSISDPILDDEMVTYDTATLRRVWDYICQCCVIRVVFIVASLCVSCLSSTSLVDGVDC